MKDMTVHFSSASHMWETPQAFFDAVKAEFHPTLDVCATSQNTKCTLYFTPQDDGLSEPWEGVCWMNPPYGREIVKWVKKAYESSLAGATVVCLLPARTDTAWWHDYVMKGEIRFHRGRLKFGGHTNSAPFPSALVIFRPADETTVATTGGPACAHPVGDYRCPTCGIEVKRGD